MFKVVVDLDTFEARETTATGALWISIFRQDFPERGWSDFPLAILPPWIKCASSLKSGLEQTVQLRFMDGPFYIEIDRYSEELVDIRCVRDQGTVELVTQTRVQLTDVMFELQRIAGEVLEYGRARNWRTSDFQALEDAYRPIKGS